MINPGGTEASALGNTGQYLDEATFPIFGICVGMQFIAQHFGGIADAAQIPEFGKTTLTITKPEGPFAGILDSPITVWESHNDEVKELPEEFEVLAHSDNCAVQGFRHVSRPIWGVQFHPEVEHTDHGDTMFRNFIKLCEG